MNSVRKKNGGFTLMEILIVVAIIAVLVAIAIPTFSGSLHKARVAADEANVRAYYAQLQAEYMLTGEYDPDIGPEIAIDSYKNTITFSDGSTVQLQAGHYLILRADETPSRPESKPSSWTGYHIWYACSKGAHELILGGGNST